MQKFTSFSMVGIPKDFWSKVKKLSIYKDKSIKQMIIDFLEKQIDIYKDQI